MQLVRDREHDDVRFRAALHDKQMPDRDGRVLGIRQRQMARMKARRGGH